MQFTEKYIQSLKAKEQRYDVREKSGNGFAIRVFPSGEKSWVVFYTFEGRKRRLTMGSYPTLSLAEARVKHRKALNMLEHGHDPGLTKQREKQEARLSFTVENLIHEYIEKWAKARKRSWKEDERILLKDAVPLWKGRKAKDITKRDVLLLLDKIKERNAPIAANRTLACVRRMFNFAVERDIIISTPCASIKAPSKENRRERSLSAQEIKIFWETLPKTGMSSSIQLALKLQLVTAQRKGEIISAEWNEIDLSSGWWVIPSEKSKNGHPHRVPLSALAILLLEEAKKYSKDSRWVFPSPRNDNPIGGTSVDHAVRRITNNFNDLEHFTPHDLRRTAATNMTGIGISRLIVSKILNHVENSVTSIYDRHSYDAEKKQALGTWGNRVNEIISGFDETDNVIALQKEYSRARERA